jgi:polysaccharide pyruvyl transferase WcaK-like protein
MTTALHRPLVVMADTRADHFHVGDEAMLAANLGRLARDVPGLEVRVLGCDATMAQIAAAAERACGVLISGGGNMSASWPGLLEQRVRLLREAARRGVPAVLGGQTLGPELTAGQRASLGAGLRTAALVGVRDEPSAQLARALGVRPDRLVLQVDDAFGLEPVAPRAADLLAAASVPYLAVTFDPAFAPDPVRAGLRSVASQLGAFAAEAGLAVVLVPHSGRLGEVGEEDGPVAIALRDRLVRDGVACALAPVLGCGETVWLTRHAAAVVSSRFHPLVFATAAGVPCLAVHRDAYTRVKLAGALARVGMQRWALAATDAETGDLAPALRELWHARAAVSAAMRAVGPRLRRRDARRWRHVLDRLGLARLANVDPAELALGWPAGEIEARAPDAPEPGEATTARRRPGRVRGVLTDAWWDAFSREGFMRLGPLLTSGEVEALRRRADDLAGGVVVNEHVLLQLDTGGAYEELPEAADRLDGDARLYRKIQGLETDDEFWPLVSHPLSLEVCARMYGPHAPLSIFRAMVMNKPAGQGTTLPWHQDGGDVWKLDRDPLVTIWVALDDATCANGCMEVVPGSHRAGLVSAQGSTLSDANAAIHCPPDRIMALEVPAGHGVFLHNWLIHRSGVNPSATPRRAFTACYMDGRTTSTLTGSRFPIVHGSAPPAWAFVREMDNDRNALRQSAASAEEYARSLEAEVAAVRAQFTTVEAYARSLQDEVAALREQFSTVEAYARSLEADRAAGRG